MKGWGVVETTEARPSRPFLIDCSFSCPADVVASFRLVLCDEKPDRRKVPVQTEANKTSGTATAPAATWLAMQVILSRRCSYRVAARPR